MNIIPHNITDTKIAEIISEDIVIKVIEDGVDLLGNLYYQGYDSIVIYERNLSPEFFDLKSGMAGEILQKFSTYKIRLAIVGDFSKFKSKSLNDFIVESNKRKHIIFVFSIAEALNILSEN